MAEPSFNPNALPSATNVRFALLAATVTLMALWYGNEVIEGLNFLNTFSHPLNFVASAVIVVCVWLLAFGVYLLHPLYCRLRFTRKANSAPGELAGEIADAARNIGVRNVKVLMDEDIWNFEAVAYGYPFRRRVLLGKGNIMHFRKRPDIFRAKLHHEFSHIRNHDVDTGFLAIGLLFAAATLVTAVITYWMANFAVFTYLYYRGEVFAIRGPLYWLLTSCLPLLMVGAVWIAALWLEHRSYIRAREFMADCEAAHWCQPTAVLAALGPRREQARPAGSPFRQKMLELTQAHPSTVQRASSVTEYHQRGVPSAGLFFAIGYLFSIIDSLATTVRAKYGSDAAVDAWSCDGAQCLSKLVETVTADHGYLFVTMITLVLADAIIVLSGATLLRGALQSNLLGQSFRGYCWGCTKIALGFAAGYVIGDVVDPFYFKALLESGFSRLIPRYPGGAINGAWHYGLVVFALAIAAYMLARYFLKGTRTKRVSETQWILVSALALIAVGQLFVGGWAALTLLNSINDPESSDERLAVVVGTSGGFIIWALLALAAARSVAGGVFRRSARSPEAAASRGW